MKKILLIISCISIITLSFSQDQNEDAKFLKIVKEYTLNEDGSVEYNYSKSLKLLSHYSFHRLYGETFIIYNTDFQNLKINSAYTIMADGKKVVTPKNAFNEVLPRFSANAPAFNNIREMVVTHTGLEVGTIINLDYTITSDAGYYPYLVGNETLSESSPIDELIIKINVPKSQPLNFALLNIDGSPNVDYKNGFVTYSWEFSSIAANSKESYQEYDHVSEPRLIYSTAADMKSAYKQFVAQEAFNYATNGSMDKVVSNIIEGQDDQLKIVLELRKIVCNNVNNLNVPLAYTATKCRTAVETWESNQGTKLEKAILLSALLKKANISANPVAVIPNQYYNESIGNFSMYNDFLVNVNLKKHGDIYIATNYINKQNLKFDLFDKTTLLLEQGSKKLKTESHKPAISSIGLKFEIDLLDTKKLLGEASMKITNGLLPYFSVYQDSSYVKSIIVGISKSDIVDNKIGKLTPSILEAGFSMEKDNPVTKQRRYYTLKLPTASVGVDGWHMTLLNDRSIPLEIPKTIHEKYEYAIVIPKGSKLVTPPTFTIIKNDVGSIINKLEQVDNKIVIVREIKFEKKVISAMDYSAFKKIMDIWNNNNYRKVIFKN